MQLLANYTKYYTVAIFTHKLLIYIGFLRAWIPVNSGGTWLRYSLRSHLKKHGHKPCFFLLYATTCRAEGLWVTFCPQISSSYCTYITRRMARVKRLNRDSIQKTSQLIRCQYVKRWINKNCQRWPSLQIKRVWPPFWRLWFNGHHELL